MTDQLLANVVDMDCVRSTNPLAFGLTSAFVTGARAILQRILARWCQLLGFVPHAPDLGLTTPLLDIAGATFSRADLAGLRGQLTKQARAEDFVTDAAVALSLTDAGLLSVVAIITLMDGGNYPLEVQAIDAINQLGQIKATQAQIDANVAFLRAHIGGT